MAKIRVLIVDDHGILREGIKAMLSYHAEVEVIGEAQDGSEALEQVLILKPDIVLMDIAMPGMDGIKASRLIKAQAPQTHILILSQYQDKEYVLGFWEQKDENVR